jgi:hypothetical protein
MQASSQRRCNEAGVPPLASDQHVHNDNAYTWYGTMNEFGK